jgi:hypothetical protein
MKTKNYRHPLYTKNVNWNETWLCVVIIGCTKKLLWKNQGRPCWIQRENNDVNVYATSKSRHVSCSAQVPNTVYISQSDTWLHFSQLIDLVNTFLCVCACKELKLLILRMTNSRLGSWNWIYTVKFVGILMLHCRLGICNTNTFHTFRCPQSLEMIRLYLYKKCKLERDMTLCGDNWWKLELDLYIKP